jgi:hypothetical protein
MTTNINLINSNNDGNRKGLERTGRIGGNKRNSVNQYTLIDDQVMVPKSVANPNSLSMKLKLD